MITFKPVVILIIISRDQGKIKEATELLIDSLNIREKTLGTDHQAVSRQFVNQHFLTDPVSRY